MADAPLLAVSIGRHSAGLAGDRGAERRIEIVKSGVDHVGEWDASGKDLTQAQVVKAGSVTVQTSKSRIARYSREVHDTFVERHEVETIEPEPLSAD